MGQAKDLRTLYTALHALTEEEQTALAEFHADDPKSLLAYRYKKSTEALERREPLDEQFYSSSRTDPASRLTPCDKIGSTIEFAAQICDGEPREVIGAESLSFRYVDRELFALRTTGEHRAESRKLDLLLANSGDGTPVLAELKIRDDKPAYFALVQLLMHAAEFLAEGQRTRLGAHAPAPGGITIAPDGPVRRPLHRCFRRVRRWQQQAAGRSRDGANLEAPH